MSYTIRYTDKTSGEVREHRYTGNENGARGWTQTLAREHNTKAICEHIADGPYDYSGKVTHVTAEGDKKS